MSQAHVGYATMLEQFHPVEAVEFTAAAERAGFRGAMVADHFQPWVPAQGNASFVWNVLTAIGERTREDLGPGVTCPSFRFHPAIVAQASATLAAMYPDRHWLGLGSGEALNEHVVGGYWPEAAERLSRMWDAIDIIQKLFTGKDVKHDGPYFRLETTRLWSMPDTPPPIYIATAGPITAKRAGRQLDGIITPGAPLDKIANLLGRFDAGAKEAGREPGTQVKILQLHMSWAPTDEEALANAMHEWPNGGMKFPKADIRSPHDFEQMAKLVRPEDFDGRMLISSDPDAHRAEIQKFFDAGVDRVYLHNVGRNQTDWIDVFGRDVLPKLTR
ncbi:MAG TPA: TIGR03557 family F420-dependent LLM class oxidoreductase [Micromonosporaceae bacterium]|jgi:G6PDH family F420-dependent oxidoreductase|nr:TIGR03557 family F420-dependent LLM class oxidoreductase [Micromonosporaceae bacterium]